MSKELRQKIDALQLENNELKGQVSALEEEIDAMQQAATPKAAKKIAAHNTITGMAAQEYEQLRASLDAARALADQPPQEVDVSGWEPTPIATGPWTIRTNPDFI